MRNVLFVLILATAPVVAQEGAQMGPTDMTHDHELLGTIDGCRVWKINYWGKFVFMARCPEGLGETNWSETTPTGKTVVTTDYQVIGQ